MASVSPQSGHSLYCMYKMSDLVPVAGQVLDLHRDIFLLFLWQRRAVFYNLIQHQELLDHKNKKQLCQE